ncbi:MAG: DUF2877 domain-containing protein [Chloroflexota bacterium]
MTLNSPEYPRGPFHIQLPISKGFRSLFKVGDKVKWRADELSVGDRAVVLKTAEHWDPMPNWSQLRQGLQLIVSRLDQVLEFAKQNAQSGESLLELYESRQQTKVFQRVESGARLLHRGLIENDGSIEEGARLLAGLGSGSTPAGDDFLTGWLMWVWLNHPHPGHIGRMVVQHAAPLTTTLSRAWLGAAARGHCTSVWHEFLNGLADPAISNMQLRELVQQVLAHGATSGADALTGFLWETQITQQG